MDNKGFIGAVGGSRTAMRQLQIWDPKNLAKAVSVIDVDQSAGNIIPHYDSDNSIMYIAGKGDAGIKYFEIVEDDPYAHFLSEYRSNDSQKGVAFLPRRGLDAKSCEIARALRLMRDSVIPVSFQVPRKGDQFQADLYPDTYAGKATNDAGGYLGGKNTPPELLSMNWKLRAGDVQEEVVQFKAQKSAADLQGELDAANAKIAKLEAQLAALKAK
jgi:coronin-1B/1C/6